MIAVCTVFLALKNTVGFYLLSLGTAVVFGITTAPVAFTVFLNGLDRKHHHAPQKQFTATLKNASICNSVGKVCELKMGVWVDFIWTHRYYMCYVTCTYMLWNVTGI